MTVTDLDLRVTLSLILVSDSANVLLLLEIPEADPDPGQRYSHNHVEMLLSRVPIGWPHGNSISATVQMSVISPPAPSCTPFPLPFLSALFRHLGTAKLLQGKFIYVFFCCRTNRNDTISGGRGGHCRGYETFLGLEQPSQRAKRSYPDVWTWYANHYMYHVPCTVASTDCSSHHTLNTSKPLLPPSPLVVEPEQNFPLFFSLIRGAVAARSGQVGSKISSRMAQHYAFMPVFTGPVSTLSCPLLISDQSHTSSFCALHSKEPSLVRVFLIFTVHLIFVFL
ncbi:uncharacterized protein BT62DRAFT_1007269 [Guyanagaster necrorhizus]|uniref:Uncharacterized protein n=1 Tax=Guyanagaster necrorhizus TaxID=856835 RepID=A0A9P8AR76_9AGAR|nr:uncharacterized protein BT62DRAFT_1007269 [Guyanagaster necrorhizus MCA 3950]KAG7444904.1 hypothetical protein BT62DRAFT_1007269 [Guyanagaster necrorhizus MCA 3950]